MYKIVILLGLLRTLLGLSQRLKYRLSVFGNELFRTIVDVRENYILKCVIICTYL